MGLGMTMKTNIAYSSLFFLALAIVTGMHAAPAKRRTAESGTTYKKTFSWWPERTFQDKKNGISLIVEPFSEQETRALFGGDGKNLITCTEWFIACPIVPIHVTIDNQTDLPILLKKESIDLGKKMFGIKREPVNLQHVLDAINKKWFSSHVITDGYVYSGTTLIATTERLSNNPYLYRSFLTIEEKYTRSSLSNLQKELLFKNQYSWSNVTIDEGQKKEILFFVWGKDIKQSEFNMTLGYNKFVINFKK